MQKLLQQSEITKKWIAIALLLIFLVGSISCAGGSSPCAVVGSSPSAVVKAYYTAANAGNAEQVKRCLDPTLFPSPSVDEEYYFPGYLVGQIEDIEILEEQIEGEYAQVRVKLTFTPQERRVPYQLGDVTLVKRESGWKIWDMEL